MSLSEFFEFQTPPKTHEGFSHQEEEIMRCVWQLGLCNVKQAIELLSVPRPPYTTVASVFKNLERKGYVASRLEGNTYIYRPAIDEQDYKRTFLGNVVGSYFKNSYKELVTFFARDNKISSDELREIIDLINKGEEDK